MQYVTLVFWFDSYTLMVFFSGTRKFFAASKTNLKIHYVFVIGNKNSKTRFIGTFSIQELSVGIFHIIFILFHKQTFVSYLQWSVSIQKILIHHDPK